jgi:Rieske Fe-S protein
LERFAQSHLEVTKIVQRWSAELFEPSDGAPYIGRVPGAEHLYLATGFSGTGLTWGTVAGELLADLILQRQHPLQDIVTPSRLKPLAAAETLIKENANVANRFVADRFHAEHRDRLGPHLDLQPGDGGIVRHENELIAVCKDESGATHACTATCTHAGCIVQWNRAERTWDCPCHGGRYDHTGRRIYGPPEHDLAHRQVDSVTSARSSAPTHRE